jgi:hypothetical protein
MDARRAADGNSHANADANSHADDAPDHHALIHADHDGNADTHHAPDHHARAADADLHARDPLIDRAGRGW